MPSGRVALGGVVVGHWQAESTGAAPPAPGPREVPVLLLSVVALQKQPARAAQRPAPSW